MEVKPNMKLILPKFGWLKFPKIEKKGDLVKTLSVPNVWPETSRIIFCILFLQLGKNIQKPSTWAQKRSLHRIHQSLLLYQPEPYAFQKIVPAHKNPWDVKGCQNTCFEAVFGVSLGDVTSFRVFFKVASWRLNHPSKIWVKLDHFPNLRDEHKEYLKPPPSSVWPSGKRHSYTSTTSHIGDGTLLTLELGFNCVSFQPPSKKGRTNTSLFPRPTQKKKTEQKPVKHSCPIFWLSNAKKQLTKKYNMYTAKAGHRVRVLLQVPLNHTPSPAPW